MSARADKIRAYVYSGGYATSGVLAPDALEALAASDAMETDLAQVKYEMAQLRDALMRVLMWISDAALGEDEDTAIIEARRICREALNGEL